MLLTCSRAECAIVFKCRNPQKYCGKACSGLAHRRPRGNCRICGKALIGPTQRVACSAKCAGTIGSIGPGRDQGIWGFGGTNSPDRLRVLWAEGHSTSEIGRRMGITKNAVVGKAHRLDLPARPSPIRGRVPGAPRPRIQRAPRVTLPVLASTQFRAVASVVAAPPSIPGGRHVTEPDYARTGRGLRVTPPARGEPAPVVAASKPPEAPKTPAAPKRRPEAETLLPRAGTPPRWGLCQFPSGNRPFKWCGNPVSVINSPYCEGCRRKAYNRPVPFHDAATQGAAA